MQITNTSAFTLSTAMDIHAIAYLSRACGPISAADLDALMLDASTHNALHDVTGVLLHDGDTFLQYIEGPRAGVEHAYRRIARSSRHHIVSDLCRGPAPRRYFQHWNMASRQASRGTLTRLGTSRWTHTLERLDLEAALPPGLDILLAFWKYPAADAA